MTARVEDAIHVAEVGPPTPRAPLQQRRTRRELLVLAGMSTTGLHVPTCVRVSTLASTGPHIAGMGGEVTAAFGPPATRTYGLDLTAAIDAPAPAHSVASPAVVSFRRAPDDSVEEYGRESFPASDPPSSWWGGTGDTAAPRAEAR